MSPCIITPFSLLANDQSSSLAASHINSSSSNSQVLTLIISVNTQLVEDLLRKLIIPCTQLPSSLVHHGVLLLGPPGVGKSYSVRAVKARCQGWCDVHIHELSIPDLLSHDDPLRYEESLCDYNLIY